MKDAEPAFCRANTLHTINVSNENEAINALKFSRSKSIARSTFPDIIVPNRYKVFSRLKERWNPVLKEKKIKQRLHLATLAGIVNLRRMELKTIPDDMFYLDMDITTKMKIKEEEVMLLHEGKINYIKEPSKATTVKVEKGTELIIEKHDTSLSLEDNKTTDDEDFQYFIDNYGPGFGYVYSYGEVVTAYLKQRVANFIKKTLANRVPLIKHDLNKTSEIQEPETIENIPLTLSVQPPQPSQQITPFTQPPKFSVYTQDSSGLMTKNIKKIQIDYKSQGLITVSRQATTGAIRKMPVKTTQQTSLCTKPQVQKQSESGLKSQSQTRYRNRPKTTGSAHLTTGAVRKKPDKIPQQRTVLTKMSGHECPESQLKKKVTEKTKTIADSVRNRSATFTIIPIKTLQQTIETITALHTPPVNYNIQKMQTEDRDLQTTTGSPLLTTHMNKKTPKKGSAELSTSNLSKIPKGKSISTGNEDKSIITGTDTTAPGDQEYCFLIGYSLFGVNPYSGEEFCILNDIRDVEEIKNKVRLFLHDLNSKLQAYKQTQKLKEKDAMLHTTSGLKSPPRVISRKTSTMSGATFQGKSYPTLKHKDSYLTETLDKVTQADSKDFQLKRSASKIPRSKASTIAQASWKSRPRSISPTSDMSTSFTNSVSNDPGCYSEFENAPEKFMFFRGDTLMCENPLTGDEFCVFQNIRDIEEIKNKVTEFILSCVPESKKAIPSSPIEKEHSDINASQYTELDPKIVSKIPVRKLPGFSEAWLVKMPNKNVKQLDHRTRPVSASSITKPVIKTTNVASKVVSQNKTSKIPRSKTSTISERAKFEHSLVSSKVVSQNKSSKIPRSITHIISERAKVDKSTSASKAIAQSKSSKIPRKRFLPLREQVDHSPHLKLENKMSSIHTFNIYAPEHTLGEVWTQNDTKDEDENEGGMGICAIDSLYKDADTEHSLITSISNLAICMDPQATSTPKYGSLKSEDGIPLLQADSCVSLLGKFRKTPVTSHKNGSKIPRITISSSAVNLTESPVIPETKSKSFTEGTKQLYKRKSKKKLSSDMSATSKSSRQQANISATSEHTVTSQPKEAFEKSQSKMIRHTSMPHNFQKIDKQSDTSTIKVKQHSVLQKQRNIKEMPQKYDSIKQSKEKMSPVGLGMKLGMKRQSKLPKPRGSPPTYDDKRREIKKKNIDVLLLDNNKLTEMSWKIGYLTNLTSIYFQNNMLTAIPNEIKKLQKLEKLQLDNNKIKILPVGLYDLKSLKLLSLKGNKLIHISSLLRYLENLEFLDISHNYLTTLPEGINKLNKLKLLEASRNEIKIIPNIFPTNLQQLFVNENQIESLPNLTNLKKLRVLCVKANNLTKLPRLPPSIKKIYANRNLISDVNESLVENWSELETLNLSQNQLRRLPENIDVMSSLKKLRLSHNEIRCLPRALGNIYCLHELDMSLNPISGIPYHLMKGKDMYKLMKYVRHGVRKFQLEYNENADKTSKTEEIASEEESASGDEEEW